MHPRDTHFPETMNSIEIDLVFGLIWILFFIFKDPDERFLYLTSLFVFVLFISQLIYFYVDILAGQIVWIVSASGFLFCYATRLNDLREGRILGFLKMMGALLLAIYPSPFYSLVNVGDGIFWTLVRPSTFPILVTVYLYDRWILKPEQMKKKYLVVLVGQSILILLMLMYSFVQKAEADRQRWRAAEQQRNAAEMREKALEIEMKYQELVKENAR